MDRITTLTKEIELLQKQKDKIEEQCELKYNDIAKAYQDFYTSKTNKEFVLYNDFPALGSLEIYCRRYDNFPLHKYGKLNVKELAEIIKHLYQFKTGKSFQFLWKVKLL